MTHRAGIPLADVPLVLIDFGAGALVGTVLGGRFGDQRPFTTAITASLATSIVLLLLALLSRNAAAAVVLVALMALTGFAVNPIVTALAVRYAGAAPTLTSALAVSWFNIGNAGGSAIAGAALGTALHRAGPAAFGTVISGLTLVALGTLALLNMRGARATGQGGHRHAAIPRALRQAWSSRMSPAWSSRELDRIGAAQELEIAVRRRDGSLRRAVPIWVVRIGDDLYVRSWRGTEGSWYRGARATHKRTFPREVSIGMSCWRRASPMSTTRSMPPTRTSTAATPAISRR